MARGTVATLRPRQLSLVSLAVAALVVVSSLLAVGVAALQADPAGPPRPAHHLLRGFRNLDGNYHYTVLERTQRMFRKTLEGWPQRGQTPRVLPNDGAALRANGTTPTLTWIGHATLLVQIGGVNVLTVGGDLAVGYRLHDRDLVHLFCAETIAAQTVAPEAVCVLESIAV